MPAVNNTAEIVALIRKYMAEKQSATTSEIIKIVHGSGYSKTSHHTSLGKLVDAGELQVDEVCIRGANHNRYTATTLLGKTRIHVGKGFDTSKLAFEQPVPEGVLLLQKLVTGIGVQACS